MESFDVIRRPLLAAFLGATLLCSTLAAPAFGQSTVQAAFSPDGQAEALVLQTIGSAQRSIRLAAYSFTSPKVVRALLAAKRRNVDVAVVVDHKNNIQQDSSGKARAALNLLVNAGIPTRTISRYAIHHDKYMVVDSQTVETGSFNYSAAAASRNSENVIVISGSPQLAAMYLGHWEDRWAKGVDYKSAY